MLNIEIIPCLEVEDNYSFLLGEGDDLAVVDPAAEEPILRALNGRKLSKILLTHHHWDHVGGALALQQRFGAAIYAFAGDSHRIKGGTHWLRESDTVTIGGVEARVWEIPGHTTGHILYYFMSEKAIFCGDTLFTLGCGKLFEGTAEQMWKSLSRIRALPDDTRVFCGHEYTVSNGRYARFAEPKNAELGSYLERAEKLLQAGKPTVPSLLGEEKAANPFLRPESVELQTHLGLVGERDLAKIFGAMRADKDSFDKG